MKFNINIPDGASYILRTLHVHGHSAYIVGGCVRDSILSNYPNDWDICTSATPQELVNIFKQRKIIETGLQHGTVIIVIQDEPYEVTTYRIDGDYSDNRRPDNVTFTSNLIEDLSRRDFTVNAMAYSEQEGLVDPFDGLSDIQNRVIKCVGEPSHRFEEDALRILRAIRFATTLDFKIDKQTEAQIHTQVSLLKNISAERITDEFCKMLTCDTFWKQLIDFYDVFCFIIPELRNLIDFNQYNDYHSYDVFMHTVQALHHCEDSDLVSRLSVFFHDFGKPRCYQDDESGRRHFKGHGKVSAELAADIMKEMRFSNDFINKVTELVRYHDATLEVGKKYVKRWLNKLSEEQFRRLLKVRKADVRGQKLSYDIKRIEKADELERILEEVLQQSECFSLKDLAVKGEDLINIGYKQGRALGATLRGLLDCVIAEEVENDKQALLELATSWSSKIPSKLE